MKRSAAKDKLHPSEIDFGEELDEEKLFERAMEGVRRLPRQDRIRHPQMKRDQSMDTLYPSDLLEEAVEGIQELDQAFVPGSLEGGSQQWNRKLMRRFHRPGRTRPPRLPPGRSPKRTERVPQIVLRTRPRLCTDHSWPGSPFP